MSALDPSQVTGGRAFFYAGNWVEQAKASRDFNLLKDAIEVRDARDLNLKIGGLFAIIITGMVLAKAPLLPVGILVVWGTFMGCSIFVGRRLEIATRAFADTLRSFQAVHARENA